MKTNMINTNSVIRNICAVVMLLGMSVSAWGADETLTVTGSFIGGVSGYGSSDGKNLATGAGNNVSIAYTDVLKGQSYLQLKNTPGYLYSKSLPASSSNNKIKTITIATVSGNSIVLSGSTATDNTGWTTISYTANTAVDVSSYNYKTFKIEASGGWASTPSVTVVYTQASPQTVTFNKQGGEFDDPSVFTNTNQITETSGGAGVTLPLVNPTASMSSMGWGFYGWATSAVGTPTTTAPTIVGKAGDTYYPSSTTTLHAVFAKGEFTKITSESEITSGGKYLIAGWYLDKVHMMTSTYIHTDDYYMKEKVVSEYTSGKIRAIDIEGTWRYTITGSSNAYFIQDVVHNSNNYIDTYNTNWYNCSYSSTHSYKIVFSNGTCYIKNNYGTYPYLVLFAAGDFGTVSSEWAGMLLYKETTECKFASNPKTVRVVASPAAGGSVTIEDEEYYVFSGASADYLAAEADVNSGYEFLRWESTTNAKFYNSSTSDYDLSSTTEEDEFVKATGDATLTAYFYKKSSVTINLTGLTKTSGLEGSNVITSSVDAADIVWTFSLNDHYRTTPTCSVTMGGSTLTEGSGNDYTWNASTKTLTFPAATDITGDLVITISAEHTEYTKYAFSCADLQLDEPANGADNVLSDVIYLTSTNGQKVRSAAHFRVHGDGLTPSQTVKFTTGDDDLDELYTFRKGDGTEIATNASGEVDEEVYIFYQPTATTDGRDEVTSLKAYVERKGDGSGKPGAVKNEERTINGRHLPSQFIIAAKSGDVWYALPADMIASSAHAGYSFTPDNTTTPTQATVAPEAAVYKIYGYATSSPTDSSYVRFASDKDSKALWSNKSNSSIGIKNYATINASSPKGDQYEWRLTNTGPNTYNLWNDASNNTGRNLGLQASDKKWNMYADGSGVVKELRLLPIVNISAYIGLLGEDWEDAAFTYTKTSGDIPEHHHVQVTYNGDTYTATESGTKITITDDDFTDAGGFTSAPGTQLTLEWCNEDGAVLAQGSLFTPIFITSNTVNLSDYDAEVLVGTDIFVTNGSKLTISENTTVHDVTVNSGATLFIDKAGESKGATLTMSSGKLTLRGGWTTIGGDPTYDMPRIYINPLSSLTKTKTTVNLYMDIYKSEEGKHYYPFAVPFPVAVSNIDYVNPSVAAASIYGKHYVIKRYDGAGRAENGVVDANWTVVDDSETLQPGEGYIITALAVGGKAQLKVPMSFANAWTTLGEQATVSATTKNVREVTHHTGAATTGGGANKRHEGWNMLSVPFMSCYTAGTDMYDGEGSADLMVGRMELTGNPANPYGWESGDVVYVSVPSHDFAEYIQTDITSAKLIPGWSFFVQVGETGDLTFLTTKQREDSDMPIYAPKRDASYTPVVKTGIVLSDGTKSDETTFLISDKYSSEYEIGADLEKMFGKGFTLSTYSITNGTNLAFNALSTYEAQQAIPVGVRIPADGQYTFSLNSRYANANIARLDLIDYETGEVTNLLQTDYTFTAPCGQNEGRFALNVTPIKNTPTDIEDTEYRVQNTDARKVIIEDKLFIIRDGLMYDATGKRVTKGGK